MLIFASAWLMLIFAIILLGIIVLSLFSFLLLFCLVHVKLFFFTCNNTCFILVNVHENHEQVYIIYL
jgi:hypothetical protein